MKMKKMMLLMLAFLIGSVASMNAQVRIGGTVDPDVSAVLDLNKTNATGAQTGNLGLALPRVNLTAEDMYLVTDVVPKNGTMVYNTTTTLGAGVYYWVTNKWVKAFGGAEVDGVIGNEITDTIAGGGLTRAGAGTAASPYKVGIKSNTSDNGKVLGSLGTTVGWVQPGMTYVYTRPVLTNTVTPPASCTYCLLFRATLTNSIPPNTVWLYRLSTTLSSGARCFTSNLSITENNTDELRLYNALDAPMTIDGSYVECWGPR